MATTESIFEGTNFLQPTGFKVVVNRKRFKNLEFFAQSVLHPDVSVAPAVAPFRGTNLQLPGDKLEYGTLTMDVILDENMNAYKEILNWTQQNVRENYISSTKVNTFNEDVSTYDIRVLILSSHNNVIDSITYKDTFPINLGTINLQANVDGVQFITFPVTFAYTTFELTD